MYEKRVDLPAPSDVVFGDLLQPEHVAEYDSHFRSWVPREQPPRVGTKVDFVARVFGVWSKGTSEFVAFSAPHHLELRLVRPSTPLRSSITWDLTDTESGSSLEYRFVIDAPQGLGWLAKLLLRQFTSHLDVELPALAHRYS